MNTIHTLFDFLNHIFFNLAQDLQLLSVLPAYRGRQTFYQRNYKQMRKTL